MPATIPLTVTQEAADFISEQGVNATYQRMLDNIPLRIPGTLAITVNLQPPFDSDGGSRVIFDVGRIETDPASDRAEENWQRWVIETFPAEQFQHFCLLSHFGIGNGRTTLS